MSAYTAHVFKKDTLALVTHVKVQHIQQTDASGGLRTSSRTHLSDQQSWYVRVQRLEPE